MKGQGNGLVIYFSGFENSDKLKKLDKLMGNGFRVSGILVTYIGLENHAFKRLKELKEKYEFSLMLDSGAFSLIKAYWIMKGIVTGTPSEVAYRVVKYNRYDWYFKRYLWFVKRYQDMFDLYAELDVQLMIGKEKVNAYRSEFVKNGLEPVVVWHGEGLDEILEMLQYSKKFGFPWKQPDKTPDEIVPLARFAKKNGANWIHWFGMTRWDVMLTLSKEKILNSVDSTSWASGQRYGVVYLIEDGDLVSLTIAMNSERIPEQVKQKRIYRYRKFLKEKRAEIEKLGLNYKKLYDLSDWQEISLMNLVTYQWALEELIGKVNGKSIKYDELDKYLTKGESGMKVRKNTLWRWIR